ncbi:PRC-barrel domain-containing protein [uncultured Corynebacterium sp.]|uniref:PRC-barrel domain-containing protein n=1 Tax=uncultured Corynebacterium sp. TaxID=159447 RepID=UPI00345C2B5A
MATEREVKDLFNATAFDKNGDKLGGVKEVFIDDDTGQPTFVEVGHGLFGMSSSLVPMRGHRLSGDDLQLAFDKDRIKDAPEFDTDNHLTPDDQRNIYDHYGVTGSEDVERYRRDDRRRADDGRYDDRARDEHLREGQAVWDQRMDADRGEGSLRGDQRTERIDRGDDRYRDDRGAGERGTRLRRFVRDDDARGTRGGDLHPDDPTPRNREVADSDVVGDGRDLDDARDHLDDRR